MQAKKKPLQVVDLQGLLSGGRCRARTCDPCRVKPSMRFWRMRLRREQAASVGQFAPMKCTSFAPRCALLLDRPTRPLDDGSEPVHFVGVDLCPQVGG